MIIAVGWLTGCSKQLSCQVLGQPRFFVARSFHCFPFLMSDAPVVSSVSYSGAEMDSILLSLEKSADHVAGVSPPSLSLEGSASTSATYHHVNPEELQEILDFVRNSQRFETFVALAKVPEEPQEDSQDKGASGECLSYWLTNNSLFPYTWRRGHSYT